MGNFTAVLLDSIEFRIETSWPNSWPLPRMCMALKFEQYLSGDKHHDQISELSLSHTHNSCFCSEHGCSKYMWHASFFDKYIHPAQFLSASPELVWDTGDVSGRRGEHKQNRWWSLCNFWQLLAIGTKKKLPDISSLMWLSILDYKHGKWFAFGTHYNSSRHGDVGAWKSASTVNICECKYMNRKIYIHIDTYDMSFFRNQWWIRYVDIRGMSTNCIWASTILNLQRNFALLSRLTSLQSFRPVVEVELVVVVAVTSTNPVW